MFSVLHLFCKKEKKIWMHVHSAHFQRNKWWQINKKKIHILPTEEAKDGVEGIRMKVRFLCSENKNRYHLPLSLKINIFIIRWKRKEKEIVGKRKIRENKIEIKEKDSEGQGSLACCSPRDHKESDTTESVKNPQALILFDIHHRKAEFGAGVLPS